LEPHPYNPTYKFIVFEALLKSDPLNRYFFICNNGSLSDQARMEIDALLKTGGRRGYGVLTGFDVGEIRHVIWDCAPTGINNLPFAYSSHDMYFHNLSIYRNVTNSKLQRLTSYLDGTTSMSYEEIRFIINEDTISYNDPLARHTVTEDNISNDEKIIAKGQYRAGSNVITIPDSLVISLQLPVAPNQNSYILYKDNEPSPTSLSMNEGETLTLNLRKILPGGTTTDDFTVEKIEWRDIQIGGDRKFYTNFNNMKQFEWMAPSFQLFRSNQYFITVDIKDGTTRYSLEISINVQDIPEVPGIFVVPSPSNTTTCKGGDALEYLQAAIGSLNTSSNSVLQAMMNTVSNKRIEINFLQSTDSLYLSQNVSSGNLLYGWAGTEYQYDVNLVLSDASSSINNCFDTARIKMNLSMNQYEEIIAAIQAIGDTTVPNIVIRIKDDNLLLGTLIESYCKITESGPALDAALSNISIIGNHELYYFPTPGELESLIYVSDKVPIYLIVDLLCDFSNYASFCPSEVLYFGTIRDWYSGLQDHEVENNTSIQRARQRKYGQTLAHEIGHYSFALSNKTSGLQWFLARNSLPSPIRICYPSVVNETQCSLGGGHEINNGDGVFACEREAQMPIVNCIQQ